MMKMAVVLVALLVSGLSAQDVTVTLADVLRFEHPGVEWVLEEPGFPEDSEITVWRDPRPKPLIADLEAIRDNPSAELLEAVRTGVFPEPPDEAPD